MLPGHDHEITAKSANNECADELFFIDRLVEILFMQVEDVKDPNEHE